jgi:hypothetical protein
VNLSTTKKLAALAALRELRARLAAVQAAAQAGIARRLDAAHAQAGTELAAHDTETETASLRDWRKLARAPFAQADIERLLQRLSAASHRQGDLRRQCEAAASLAENARQESLAAQARLYRRRAAVASAQGLQARHAQLASLRDEALAEDDLDAHAARSHTTHRGYR